MPGDLLEVGRITKAHGLRGEVVVNLYSDLEDRLAPGAELTTETGTLCVVARRRHQGRHLVTFEGIADRTAAEALRGTALFAPARHVDGVLWVHEMIGCEVTTTDGVALGRVEAVEANPASDLLVLEDGQLIPMRFVVEHEASLRVVVEIPEGLVD